MNKLLFLHTKNLYKHLRQLSYRIILVFVNTEAVYKRSRSVVANWELGQWFVFVPYSQLI